ncbi:hypothetical protein BTO05_11600 [Winogradskyella sp. PC-19]|uniref:LamG-like jellyroll fold domain-containing protein n=1 Tax=unclassified Winogradskyella TaxID=2615021 RepID=UPI000B3C05FE|nr:MULTISPECIES: LamG-like jellyroll fold domain-containing protein [unclassified Winogradskyella]ARV10249.1 hypothetical protein BTO05_11600 [Winogradskyella sp. PC-19]
MKTKLLFLMLLLGAYAFTQIPIDDTKRYLFINGSLQNDANPGTSDLVRSGNAPSVITGQDGIPNNAVQLLGTSFNAGQISASQFQSTNQEVSISVWIKIEFSSSATRGIFRQTHSNGTLYGYDFYYSGTTLKMYSRHSCFGTNCDQTNTLSSSTTINDNQWHHVVFSVYKEQGTSQERYVQRLYIDGVLDASYDFPFVASGTGFGPVLWSNNNNLLIAQQPQSQFYEGALDDIRLYERALTNDEIVYLSGGTPPPVVNIPDVNFKSWLVNNASVNTNGDTEIQVSEAMSFSGTLQPIGVGILDWTGIESFTALTRLDADTNNASTIDLSQNINLHTFLYAEAFQLATVVLPNSNTLQIINITDSKLSSLDLSNYTNLTAVGFASGSLLSSLDLRNGNNTSITSFNSQFTPNLNCIFVDDKMYSQTNWINIDAANNFVETEFECNSLTVTDFNFNKIKMYPNPTRNTLNIEVNKLENSYIRIFDITGNEVITTNQKQINISQLKSGVYILKALTISGEVVKRFIKQ